LASLLSPWHSAKTRLDLYYLQRFSSQFESLSGEVHRFDAAREIHERLSSLLGDEKRTFFDSVQEEVKEGERMVVVHGD
jgi:hypothetical protein